LKEDIYISFGSNKGDRIKIFRRALLEISSFNKVLACSPVYETPPWGFDSSEPFLNAVIKVQSKLNPKELLEQLLRVEKNHGRYRTAEKEGYEDRSLDLDILLYGNRSVNDGNLQIPHPRMGKRKFILYPLSDIAPELIHPTSGKEISEILRTVKDDSHLIKTKYEFGVDLH